MRATAGSAEFVSLRSVETGGIALQVSSEEFPTRSQIRLSVVTLQTSDAIHSLHAALQPVLGHYRGRVLFIIVAWNSVISFAAEYVSVCSNLSPDSDSRTTGYCLNPSNFWWE